MKNFFWRASTFAFAAGVAGTLACGASASSCGGTNINSNGSSATTMRVQCGVGTYLSNNQCIPRPTAGSNASAPVKTITR